MTSTIFTPESVSALDSEPWLRAARQASAQAAAAQPWPTAAEEIWRYSRIDDFDPSAYRLDRPTTTVTGITPSVITEGQWRSVMTEPVDVFAAWNDAFAEVLVIHIGRGQTASQPVVIDHEVPAGAAVFPRLVVLADENAEVTVIERFHGGENSLVVPVLELHAAQSARVRYQSLNDLAPTAWSISNQVARADRDATATLAAIAIGGSYSRVRTAFTLAGQGAHGQQIGVSFGEFDQMHDLRVTQVHSAPKTTSDLSFKSAVQDRARSVYTGLIKIDKNAKGSSAFQTNRNIKLSAEAWAESVPNLDIENNDVKCSHASTVGPIDIEQRFYLESRGIPTAVAERLIVLGFFDEIIANLPDPSSVSVLHESIAAKLDRRAISEGAL